MVRRKDPASYDWASVTASREAWERFCRMVGLRFTAVATLRVRERGETIAEAVNAAIAEEAEDMRAKGAPEPLVTMFVRDYTEARAHQMELVSDYLELWRMGDEVPVTKTGRRKRKRVSS